MEPFSLANLFSPLQKNTEILEKTEPLSAFERLPQEIIVSIMRFMDRFAFFRFIQTSKTYYELKNSVKRFQNPIESVFSDTIEPCLLEAVVSRLRLEFFPYSSLSYRLLKKSAVDISFLASGKQKDNTSLCQRIVYDRDAKNWLQTNRGKLLGEDRAAYCAQLSDHSVRIYDKKTDFFTEISLKKEEFPLKAFFLPEKKFCLLFKEGFFLLAALSPSFSPKEDRRRDLFSLQERDLYRIEILNGFLLEDFLLFQWKKTDRETKKTCGEGWSQLSLKSFIIENFSGGFQGKICAYKDKLIVSSASIFSKKVKFSVFKAKKEGIIPLWSERFENVAFLQLNDVKDVKTVNERWISLIKKEKNDIARLKILNAKTGDLHWDLSISCEANFEETTIHDGCYFLVQDAFIMQQNHIIYIFHISSRTLEAKLDLNKLLADEGKYQQLNLLAAEEGKDAKLCLHVSAKEWTEREEGYTKKCPYKYPLRKDHFFLLSLQPSWIALNKETPAV